MKKSLKILSILFAMILVFQSIPVRYVHAESNVYEVSNFEELENAVKQINSSNAEESIISLKADILYQNYSPTSWGEQMPIYIEKNTTILGNGHVINYAYNQGKYFQVKNGATLSLGKKNGNLQENTLTITSDITEPSDITESCVNRSKIRRNPMIDVGTPAYSVGTLNMYEGVKITKAVYNGGGGGSAVSVICGTFNMYGGEIVDNTSIQDGAHSGAAVYLYYEFGKTELNIFDGKISNNKVTSCVDNNNGQPIYGGGVFSAYMPVNIYGGEISKNTVTLRDNNVDALGGGIFIMNSTLNLQGGSVIGNTAKRGGGIYAHAATVNIGKNVVIKDNKAAESGGGIFANLSTLNFDNVAIEDNVAEKFGGGIYLNRSKSNIDINTQIKGNSAKTGGGILAINDATLNIAEGSYVANNIASAKGNDIAYYGGSISLGNAKSMHAKLTTDSSNKDIDGWYKDDEKGGWKFYDPKEVDPTQDIPTNTFIRAAYKDSLKATYKFISSNSENALPKEVLDLLPTDDNKYNNGDVVDAKQPAKTTVSVDNGTWNFKGYDEKSKAIKDASVEFIGTWEFTKGSFKNTSKSAPKTGDTQNLPIYILLASISLSGIMLIIKKYKSNK